MQIDRSIADLRATEPPRDYALMRCIEAWQDLSTCRSFGWAPGPIPITAIWEWCDRNGLDDEATVIMTHVIRVADVDHAQRAAAKQAIESATKKRGKS